MAMSEYDKLQAYLSQHLFLCECFHNGAPMGNRIVFALSAEIAKGRALNYFAETYRKQGMGVPELLIVVKETIV